MEEKYVVKEEWTCHWKDLKESNTLKRKGKDIKQITEFLLEKSEELFLDDRDRHIKDFEKMSKTFVTWEELTTAASTAMNDMEQKKIETSTQVDTKLST
eukprot:TRINITY_DN518_c0_g1_i1.p2 TRINITY_DN518_c0_g1~~TRINITY_DN518_c0_g1_i1.p2  ORF type:complete len:99 (+),score=28.76 TRINITY_DN518_c0_g1_i1:348-644(+)